MKTFLFKYNNTVMDKRIKIIFTAFHDIKTTNNLFTQYRITSSLNKNIVRNTDWHKTKWSLTYNSITNMNTSTEEQTIRSFKLKLFMDELPTKSNLQYKYSNIIKNSLCSCCKK